MLAAIVFNRTPFFRGKDNFEQLHKIEEVLGSEDLRKYIAKYNLRVPEEAARLLSDCKKQPWSVFASHGWKKFINDDLFDFLDKTLVYDHMVRVEKASDEQKRLTAKEAMNHKYFDLVRADIEKELGELPQQESKRRKTEWSVCYKQIDTNYVINRHLMTSRGRISAEGLPGIVNPPLQTRKSTDHQNTRSQTVPASLPSQELHSLDHRDLLSRVVHLGHARVERMRDQRTEDTGNVTRSEGDRQLHGLAVGLARLREHVLVEHGDDVLERSELHHRVGDLTAPQRHHTLPQRLHASLLRELLHGRTQLRREVGLHGRRLNTHLGGLHGAQEDIGEELGRRGSSQVDGVLVVLGSVDTHHIDVQVLEQLVASELKETLHSITAHSGLPSSVQSVAVPARLRGLLQTIPQRRVHSGIRLAAALHQIQGSDERVRGSAGKNSSHEASRIEAGVVLGSIRGLQSLERTSAEHR